MIRRNRLFFRFSILVAMIVLLAAPVWAQEATPEATAETTTEATSTNLTYSVPVAGSISSEQFSQTWTLQTASADRIRVRVERTEGNLIPDVAILDVNNQQLSTSYGPDRTLAAAQIDTYTLPAAGTYQILVQRKDGASGVTTGGYSLTVLPLATADDNPNNRLVLGEVQADTPVSGEITNAHWYQRYTFRAAAADLIQVVVERTGGTLFPEVDVLDANGTALQTGYTEYSGDLAHIDNLALPGPGEYTVAVTRNRRFDGSTVGTYNLSVNLLGAGENSPLLSQPAGTVEYGAVLEGSIGAVWYQDWQFSTQAGDTITVTVERGSSGNLQPEVLILGGSGQELRRGYIDETGARSVIDRYQLQGAGSYTIRVLRSGDQRGVTTGPYTLTVTLNGSGEGSPALQGTAGTVEIGATVEGEVTDEAWLNTWTYQGRSDQRINITVERTSGTLVPIIEIRDANGQTLTTAYYEASADRARFQNYALPSDGQYLIAVYRDGDQNGYTSGGYQLRVEAASQ